MNTLPEMSLEEAEKLWQQTEYAFEAVEIPGNEINSADAAAFFLEGYEYARRIDMGTNDSEQAVQSSDLLAAAQLLDDCLIRIYPEEFPPDHRKAAAQRFFDCGGTIGRIATMADKLRQAANAPAEARRSHSLQPDVGRGGGP